MDVLLVERLLMMHFLSCSVEVGRRPVPTIVCQPIHSTVSIPLPSDCHQLSPRRCADFGWLVLGDSGLPSLCTEANPC